MVHFLGFIDYHVTQYLRENNKNPPDIIYIIGDILINSVKLIEYLNNRVEQISIKALRVPWVFSKKGFYALPLIFIPIWFLRPQLGNSGFGTLIDNGVSWWCSLEHWSMVGEWKPSNLTCRYPNLNPRWDTFLKTKEYELKQEIQRYTKEIEIQKNNPEIYYKRGESYFSLENTEAAFRDYSNSVEVDKNYAPGYVGRGDFYLLIRKDRGAAFKEYINAINADKNYAPGYVGRGNVNLAVDNDDLAFKDYILASTINPQYAPIYVGKGDIYQKRQDKDQALNEYKEAIRLDPDYAFAYARIGNLYYRNFDNRERAIQEYERAAKIFLESGQINFYNEIMDILNDLNRYIVYTVQSGDFLSKVAQNQGVPVEVIVSANKETYPTLITNPNYIESGWKLKIPQ